MKSCVSNVKWRCISKAMSGYRDSWCPSRPSSSQKRYTSFIAHDARASISSGLYEHFGNEIVHGTPHTIQGLGVIHIVSEHCGHCIHFRFGEVAVTKFLKLSPALTVQASHASRNKGRWKICIHPLLSGQAYVCSRSSSLL